jgi:predicted DNA-binding transcriptional regulator AlpA
MTRPASTTRSHKATDSASHEARPAAPVERLTLRLKEVARSLGVDRRTVERQRSAGRFPPPDLKMGKMPLWKPETIRSWIENGGGA